MSIARGTKVRVDREATYHIEAAAKKAKKTYLLGKVVSYDSCCGCYIIEFTRNIGTDSLFNTSGKRGYLDEVKSRYLTTVPERKAEPKPTEEPKAEYPFAKGTYVKYIRKDTYGPAKYGAIGIVRVPGSSTGVQFIKGHIHGKGHDLDGSVKDRTGWWLTRDTLVAVDPTEVFSLGDRVRVVAKYDAATVGLVGTVKDINSWSEFHPYGVQFDKWTKGHSLTGALTGKQAVSGQWVPASSLTEAEPTDTSKPEVKTLSSKPVAKVSGQYVVEGGFHIKVLKSLTTAKGQHRLEVGSVWSADRISNVYGRTYYAIPFGGGNTILATDEDVEVL